MSSNPKQSPTRGFAWDAERAFPLIFPVLVLLSLLAHVATFFLFQVKYPQRVTIPPLAPQVTILSPDLPEHQPLLAWIAAEDPALSAATARASVPGIQQIPYQPSYAATRTWPKPAPIRADPVPVPAGRSGLEILDSTISSSASVEAPLPPMRTMLSFSESLAARALSESFNIDARTGTPLETAQFLLGVSAEGEVRFCFLRQSSGDSRIDDATARALARRSFAPDSSAITWGFVTVSWGDEVYTSSQLSQITE